MSGSVSDLLGLLLKEEHSKLNNTCWVKLISKSISFNDIVKSHQNWEFDTDIINSKLTEGMLIVNMSLDPYNHLEEYVVDKLLKITNNFVILSGDVTYFLKPKNHICFLPFWYLIQKYRIPKGPASNSPRTYAVSSLNGRSRYHRIENFIKLKEKSYFNKMLFSMHNNFDMQNEKRETPMEYWDENIAKKFESLLTSKELQEGHTNDHSTMHPAYTDSYVNYVTETSIVNGLIFPSEKTWKPFLTGQFGIWLSNAGHVEFLRAIGFDMFDDILDHSYDKEKNLHQRIDLLHKLLDHIMEIDLTQAWQDTVTRRQANADLFYSNNLEELLTTQSNEYQL